MKKMISATVALAIASPACAAPMWQNIESGMTREQVTALYPAAETKKNKTIIKAVEIMPTCPAKVEISYDASGGVNNVTVKGKGSLGAICSNQVREAVLAKYGEPINRDDLSSDLNRQFGLRVDNLMWSIDGVTIMFTRDENAGLAGPSWVMEYNAANQKVKL